MKSFFDFINKKSFFLIFAFLFCFLPIQFSHGASWEEPTSDPPGGNIDVPLNQGNTNQVKTGGLTIGSGSVDNTYRLKVVGKANFSGDILEVNSGLKLSGVQGTIDGVNLSFINGGGINLSNGVMSILDGRIDIKQTQDNTRGININLIGSGDAGVFVDDTSEKESTTGVYATNINGTAIYGNTSRGNAIIGNGGNDGIGIWGSGKTLAGRFDGEVLFYKNGSIDTSVDIKDGHILSQSGISTVNRSDSFRDKTVFTKELCFGDTTGTPDCRTVWSGPGSESDYIWNSNTNSALIGGASQDASIRLSYRNSINNAIFFKEDAANRGNYFTGIGTKDPSSDLEVNGDLMVVADAFNVGGAFVAGDIKLKSSTSIFDVSSGKIVNLKNPTNNQDAATKKYVDDSLVAAGADKDWSIDGEDVYKEKGRVLIGGKFDINNDTTNPAKLKIVSTKKLEGVRIVSSDYSPFVVVGGDDSTNYFRINQNGNVGIGKSNPSQKFVVYQASSPINNSLSKFENGFGVLEISKNYGANKSLLYLDPIDSVEGIRVISGNSADPLIIRNSDDSNDLLKLDKDGKLSVPNLSANRMPNQAYQYVVIDTSGNFYSLDAGSAPGSSTSSYWMLSGNKLYASSTSYNIGIGTTNPAYKLDVSGDIGINGVKMFWCNGNCPTNTD